MKLEIFSQLTWHMHWTLDKDFKVKENARITMFEGKFQESWAKDFFPQLWKKYLVKCKNIKQNEKAFISPVAQLLTAVAKTSFR